MKNLLILSLIMVSVTASADVLKINCDSTKTVDGNNGKIGAIPATFSGRIEVTTQADEVVFADLVVGTLKNEQGAQVELLTVNELAGTQKVIKAGELANTDVTQIEVSNAYEEGDQKVGLTMNLGMQGRNSRLTVNNEISYVSNCEVVGLTEE